MTERMSSDAPSDADILPSEDQTLADSEPAPDEAGEPGDAGEPDAPDADEASTNWGRPDWIACAVLMLCAVVLVGLHVRAYPTLSPIDELQHVDYVIKAGNLEIPHVNDLVGDDAMSEAACRSVDAPSYIGPLCGLDEYDPEDFQENGVNTAARQYPPYYVVTGLVSRAVVATGVIGSQVTAARMVGALWAGLAWSVMWYIMSLLGIERSRRAAVLTIVIATPLTLFHAATVNADAILMLTGATALLATLKYEAGRLHWSLLLLAFFALYAIEPSAFLAVCACAAYLIARTSFRPDLALWRRLMPVGVIAAVPILREYANNRVRDALFPPSPRTNRPTASTDNAIEGVDWDKVLAQLDANFLPITRAYLPPFLREQSTVALIQLSNWLLIALLAIAALSFVSDRRAVWLSRAGMATLLVAGPFYTWSFAYFSSSDFPAPGRFGLPMIAFIVVASAAALRTRAAFVAAAAVGVASVAHTGFLLLAA